jgi:hypothetical protein
MALAKPDTPVPSQPEEPASRIDLDAAAGWTRVCYGRSRDCARRILWPAIRAIPRGLEAGWRRQWPPCPFHDSAVQPRNSEAERKTLSGLFHKHGDVFALRARREVGHVSRTCERIRGHSELVSWKQSLGTG